MLSSNHFDKTYFSSDKVNSVIIKENEFSLSIEVLALLDTLEYLRRSGRITSLVAFVREILSIKPVIAIVEGKVSYLGKQEEQKNGKNLLAN